MRQKIKRILSSALAAVTVLNTFVSALPQAAAFAGGDSVTLVFKDEKQNYFREQKNRHMGKSSNPRELRGWKRREILGILHGPWQARYT